MASGALSSLGIGSNVLTYDIIEKLREADEKAQVSPIDSRLEDNIAKQKDLTQVMTHLSSLKGSASGLSSYLTYQGREVSTNGTSASLSVKSGASIGSFSIDVTKLAEKDTYQTKAYESQSTSLGLTSGDITLTIKGEEFTISVDGSTTLDELGQKINDQTDGSIQAKILNVGGATPYRLIIQSAETGSEEAITFGGNATILNELNLDDLGPGGANEANHLTTATNAEFKYDGVTMERPTNTIDDITFGMTIQLSDEGKTSFTISQDKQAILDEMEGFVSAYNNLVNDLEIYTDYNVETGSAGSLQGVSQISSLQSSLKRLLTSMDTEGRALANYGITLQENGTLKFDEGSFLEKLNEDPTNVEDFFKGMTTYDPISYTPTNEVSAGAISISENQFTINGVSVLFTSDAAATAEENAQALRDAINSTDISGVVASLDSTGKKILLSQENGGDLEISGEASTLSSIGLNQTAIYNAGETSVGIFSKLEDLLSTSLGENGTIGLFESQLSSSQNRLQSERLKTIEQLNQKYEMMVTQFAAYDNIIANLNNQFSALQSMIDAEVNSKQ
jgi:flagellar hook-associated protein 2